LAAAVARCRRVRVRVRVSRDALALACTPARACRSPGGEAGPLAPSLAPDLQFALLSAAPPWPRCGGLPCARGRRGGSAAPLTGECTLRHRPSFPRAFEPSCGRLARRHPWRRPKLRRTARFQSVPGLSPCRSPLHARAPQRAPSHARRAPPDQRRYPRQHQCHVAGAGLAATSTSSRPCALRAQQPKGVQVVAPCWPDAQAPWDSSRGEVYPHRRYPCRHLTEHLGSQLLAQVRASHGWPHAGVATANPPGSAAASRSRPRPHARLHRTKPHRPPQDPMRRPMARKPPRGPQGSKPHPRSGDPVRLGLFRGGF
jgi:hypothetical protein